jgi:hypothetical protein
MDRNIMRQTLTTVNHTNVPIRVISELKSFNGITIQPKTSFIFSADIPEDLKIFCKRVTKDRKLLLWVGLIDKDANL